MLNKKAALCKQRGFFTGDNKHPQMLVSG